MLYTCERVVYVLQFDVVGGRQLCFDLGQTLKDVCCNRRCFLFNLRDLVKALFDEDWLQLSQAEGGD